ncbi:MAG: putative dehydrogenase [Chitinophagaceae bacterium]|nr:putative dehydrogenase [Chitinophagaceae bacterium]
MGNQSSNIEFALIGHQDCWKNITRFVDFLSDGKRNLTAEQVAEVYSFIPPRMVFDVEVRSVTGQVAKGCYIETFIAPDELGMRYWKKNVIKVKEAAECARKMHAGIAGLGGFTSIVLEGKDNSLNETSSTKFTTGNSLTAAFIVKNIEKACSHFNKDLRDLQLLIIGATGDIGSACVQYFSGKVKKFLLCARQQVTLDALTKSLHDRRIGAEASTDIRKLLPEADIVIAITSSTIENFDPLLCKKDIIICDAGYPKNLVFDLKGAFSERLFCGGMGQIKGGYSFTPQIHHEFYDFPVQNAGHGCMQEAIVLALEKNYQPYSTGKGNITPEKIECIYELARKHGITEAPLFNSLGMWS